MNTAQITVDVHGKEITKEFIERLNGTTTAIEKLIDATPDSEAMPMAEKLAEMICEFGHELGYEITTECHATEPSIQQNMAATINDRKVALAIRFVGGAVDKEGSQHIRDNFENLSFGHRGGSRGGLTDLIMELVAAEYTGQMVGELSDEGVAEGQKIIATTMDEQIIPLVKFVNEPEFDALPPRYRQLVCIYLGAAMCNYDLMTELTGPLAKGDCPARSAVRGAVSDLIRRSAAALHSSSNMVHGLLTEKNHRAIFKDGTNEQTASVLTAVIVKNLGDTQESVAEAFWKARDLSERQGRDRFKPAAFIHMDALGLPVMAAMAKCHVTVDAIDYELLEADMETAIDMLKGGKFDQHLSDDDRAKVRAANV